MEPSFVSRDWPPKCPADSGRLPTRPRKIRIPPPPHRPELLNPRPQLIPLSLRTIRPTLRHPRIHEERDRPKQQQQHDHRPVARLNAIARATPGSIAGATDDSRGSRSDTEEVRPPRPGTGTELEDDRRRNFTCPPDTSRAVAATPRKSASRAKAPVSTPAAAAAASTDANSGSDSQTVSRRRPAEPTEAHQPRQEPSCPTSSPTDRQNTHTRAGVPSALRSPASPRGWRGARIDPTRGAWRRPPRLTNPPLQRDARRDLASNATQDATPALRCALYRSSTPTASASTRTPKPREPSSCV
jgi:hypothetical protein